MPIPEANLTIKDGALGVVVANGNNVGAKVGQCSGGVANTVYTFSDPTTLKNTLGTGPLVEAALYQLAVGAQGISSPVICVKAPSSAAGAAGSLTPTKTGTITLAVSGAALDAYDLQVVIVQPGATLAAGTATFKYSLDGGRTWSAETAVPTGGVYVIPNTGLTLTWTYASGTAFVAADQWVATVTGPSSSLSELMTAIDALLADGSLFFNVHVMGVPADISAAAALFAALETKLQTAAGSQFRFVYGTMEMPQDTDANIKTAFNSLQGTRTEPVPGFANLTSAVSGAGYKRPAAWVEAARAAAVPPSEDPGRVKTGPVAGVLAISRDEFKTPGLDAARMTTLRTIVGRTGFYVTQGLILAPTGSDFSSVMNRRVMDIASTVVRNKELDLLNDSVEVDKITGRIAETDARTIENIITTAGRQALTQTSPPSATDFVATVDRTTNVISLQKITIKYRVTPRGYLKAIDGEIGFFNPALVPV